MIYELAVVGWLQGCDALLKNKDGRRARKLAAATGHRATAKACRRAERTRATLTGQLWAVKLYDFCTERRSSLLKQLSWLAHDKAGVVPSASFIQVVFCHFVPCCLLSYLFQIQLLTRFSWPPCVADADIIFLSCSLFFFFFLA